MLPPSSSPYFLTTPSGKASGGHALLELVEAAEWRFEVHARTLTPRGDGLTRAQSISSRTSRSIFCRVRSDIRPSDAARRPTSIVSPSR